MPCRPEQRRSVLNFQARASASRPRILDNTSRTAERSLHSLHLADQTVSRRLIEPAALLEGVHPVHERGQVIARRPEIASCLSRLGRLQFGDETVLLSRVEPGKILNARDQTGNRDWLEDIRRTLASIAIHDLKRRSHREAVAAQA